MLKRLEFLENELFWTGRVKRLTLMEKTGISKAQASNDIAHYKKLAANNLIYDLTEKTYRIAPAFTPVFINTAPQVYLEGLASSSLYTERLPFPARDIDPEILRLVVSTIEKKGFVSITYQSMSSPVPKDRLIVPHSFVSDGLRWHIRAFDALTSTFRDFLLARIISISETASVNGNKHLSRKENDKQWGNIIVLELIPHPKLSPQQKSVIERDFGMKNGVVSFPVRQACLFYVVRQLRLLDESSNPAQQQVILKNRREITGILSERVGEE